MKNTIRISQLKEGTLGIRIDKINNGYLSAVLDKISEAHRNDHHICILLSAGKAELLLDFKKIVLQADELLFLYPEQVKQVISFKDSEGWILFFQHSFAAHQSNITFEESLYQGSIFALTSTDKKWLSNAFELLYSSYKSDALSSFQQPVMESLLNACIYKISSLYEAHVQMDIQKYSSRKINITRAFQKLLVQKYKTIKSPGEYAKMMNISLGYLNDTVKMVTGMSISDSIQKITVVEAQRLLYYSTLSIKEIAEKVGYDDPQYFSRVFSKMTQLSPGNFRKKAHQLS